MSEPQYFPEVSIWEIWKFKVNALETMEHGSNLIGRIKADFYSIHAMR
jgi:hypothetical protein